MTLPTLIAPNSDRQSGAIWSVAPYLCHPEVRCAETGGSLQIWCHPRLFKDFAEGLAEVRENLKRMGLWEQTLVMTYSEFGGRAAENGSEGTDHGTANTHFVMGGRSKVRYTVTIQGWISLKTVT